VYNKKAKARRQKVEVRSQKPESRGAGFILSSEFCVLRRSCG
jgi:hypothetical protein